MPTIHRKHPCTYHQCPPLNSMKPTVMGPELCLFRSMATTEKAGTLCDWALTQTPICPLYGHKVHPCHLITHQTSWIPRECESHLERYNSTKTQQNANSPALVC